MAAALQRVELFVDLEITGDELERMTRFYGTFLARQIAAGSTAQALFQICPALTVTTLLARAARLNDLTALSTEYFTGLGLAASAEHIALIDGHVAELLAAANLDVFDAVAAGPDGERGRLFAHVGIASDWVPDVIAAIEAELGQQASAADSEGVVGVAQAQAIAAGIVDQLAHHPRQIGPLCATAPTIATRLIAPLVQLVHHALEQPLVWAHTIDPDVRALIPQLILEDVLEELRERPAGTVNRRYAVGVARRESQPRLLLDVRRQRVVLRLPALPLHDEDSVRWRVDVDGQAAEYRAWPADATSSAHVAQAGSIQSGHGGISERLDIPMRHAARELRVRSAFGSQHWEIPMVASADPVLIFSDRGADLTQRVTLHRSRVYVVQPADCVATDPVRGVQLPVLSEVAMKTWTGWVIRLIDISDALALHVASPETRVPSMDSVRSVDPRQRVRFVEPADRDGALAGVFTISGKEVHAQSLHVEFPPTISGSAETWFLSIAAYAGPGLEGEAVTEEEPVEVPAEGGMVDVFDPEAWDSPWVGEYVVRLRGPRNESFRHEFALVEGLRVEQELAGPGVSTRLAITAGLTPATVRLLPGSKPFHPVTPVVLDPLAQSAVAVIATDAGDALPVTITPAIMRYQLVGAGEDPMWRTDAVVCSAASIDVDSKVRVRPGVHILDPRVVVRNHHGAPVGTLKLETVDGVTWSCAWGRAASSLNALAEGTIELEFVDAGKKLSVRLARIVPESTVSARLDGASLVLEGELLKELPRVAAWVWPATAPWRSAFTIPMEVVADGAAARGQLPEELIGAGELHVQWFQPDRNRVLRAPASAGPRSQVVVQEGYFGIADREGTAVDVVDGDANVSQELSGAVALSAYLAGCGSHLPHDAATLSLLWDVQSAKGVQRFVVSDALRTALGANPKAAAHAMSESLVPAMDRIPLFIAAGLASASFIPLPDAHPSQRSDAPWIAALEILGELASLSATTQAEALADVAEQGFANHDELGEQHRAHMRALKDELGHVAGQPAVLAVETGRDVSLESACIDATTVQIAHMDPAQQTAVLDSFFGSAGVVPGALSEENSRLIAVFQSFQHRDELNALLAEPTLMATAVSLLRRVKQVNRQLYLLARIRLERLDAVDTENPANRWAVAPVVSIVFAIAARLRAHGHISSSSKLDAALDGWVQLARIVPDLVISDIVLADAMVLGAFGT